MPRNTATKSRGAGPDVLRFIASLLFLYVVFGAGSSGLSSWVTSGAGALWLPILFGVAVLGSIGLFFGSLGSVFSAKARASMGNMGSKVLMWTGFALIALTVSPAWSWTFWVVVLGFLIGWFGSALEMM